MIKLIIFDLDGVLVDARELHYEALNRALQKYECTITRDEHLSTYDGLPTTKKLKLLTKNKGLSPEIYDDIWKDKQTQTREIIDKEFTFDERVRGILSRLKQDGYNICVCSNSIRETTKMMLIRRGFMEYIEFIISNQDVMLSKPNPEMFLKAMIKIGVGPKECVIVEDSHVGRQAAFESGGYLCAVENTDQVSYERIKSTIDDASNKNGSNTYIPKWQGGDLQIVIPMAGAGKSFQKAGYKFPKFLIDIAGKPMIQWVTENINAEAKYIFILNKDEYNEYNMRHMLPLLVDNLEIVTLENVTSGAPQSVLMAQKAINNEKPLAIINADQFMDWNSNEFFYAMAADECDGGIVTFESTHPKYSFVKTGDDGFITECAEKKPISRNATAGVYYFRRGKDFVDGAKAMIRKKITTNGQYFVCPIYNELIAKGMKIRKYDINKVWSFAIPEELEYFEKNHQKGI
jgi:HAD superfamily hydrolase (TIGR01509 family)